MLYLIRIDKGRSEEVLEDFIVEADSSESAFALVEKYHKPVKIYADKITPLLDRDMPVYPFKTFINIISE